MNPCPKPLPQELLRVQFMFLHSLRYTPMNRLTASVASFVMHGSKLCRVTFTTVDAPSRAVVLLGRTAAYIRLRVLTCYCQRLLYTLVF